MNQAKQAEARFTPVDEPAAAPPGPPWTPPRPHKPMSRPELVRNAVLWITICVLGIAVFAFVLSVNSIISIWFRSQWAPVARAVVALAAIAFCAVILFRLTGRKPAAST